jgi:hypothetical protein
MATYRANSPIFLSAEGRYIATGELFTTTIAPGSEWLPVDDEAIAAVAALAAPAVAPAAVAADPAATTDSTSTTTAPATDDTASTDGTDTGAKRAKA